MARSPDLEVTKGEGTSPQELSVRPNDIPICSLPSPALQLKTNKMKPHTHTHTHTHTHFWKLKTIGIGQCCSAPDRQNNIIQLFDRGVTDFDLQARSSLSVTFFYSLMAKGSIIFFNSYLLKGYFSKEDEHLHGLYNMPFTILNLFTYLLM